VAVGLKGHHLHSAVEIRAGGEQPPVPRESRSQESAARIRGDYRGVVLAPRTHEGSDDLRVPAHPGPDLQHPGAWPDAEEEQRILWVAVWVLRVVRYRSLVAGQNPVQRFGGSLSAAARHATCEQRHAGQQEPEGDDGNEELRRCAHGAAYSMRWPKKTPPKRGLSQKTVDARFSVGTARRPVGRVARAPGP